MLLQRTPPLHLTYCLNIHRGESWPENFAAIRDKALAVRDRVAAGARFGLGLRIGKQAALDLSQSNAREQVTAFFEKNDVYPFTINGFPYGQFHSTRVKEQVYAPDWQTTERRDY